MQSKPSHRKQETGQGLVEFALAAVLLLVLGAGVIDLGRGFFTFMALRDAAQEGAAYASIDPTNRTEIENRARGSSTRPVDLSNRTDIQVQINAIGASCAGNGVEIVVSYNNFPLMMPFLGAILGSQTIPIRARVTDTILTPPCR
jgi:hypothetical protein